ncbi:MAG TPA: type II secretion system protein N, partial [Woeseiaceae bacterium]|nr:type II secretion system protein N [Woeseiaceae bacterium]
MQPRSRLAAIGAAVFLAGLVVLFPARVAYHWVAPEAVRLAGIDGTIWSGSAEEAALGDFYAGAVGWRLQPLALFTGKIGYAVTATPVGGSFASAIAIAPGGTVHFSDLDARLPIAALGGEAALAGTDGRVALQFGSLVLEDGYPVRAAGAAEVTDLVLSALSPSPLG